MAQRLLPICIDDMAIYVPKLFLDIKTLAEKRDIPYEKLSQGLGCLKMAICDVHEDAATMAAEAIAELIERNQLDPSRIGRIYLGYTGLGIAQLAVGLVTCGIGALIWGIIDAVMILTDKVRDPQGYPLRDGT